LHPFAIQVVLEVDGIADRIEKAAGPSRPQG
jgi:hypothetical protein